jgi:hypothetical protein
MVNILFNNNHDLLREIEISKKHILVKSYHKYYRDTYNSFIVIALDDMIREANPIFFKDFDSPIAAYIANDHNFIQLVTWAWQNYLEAPIEFRRQEQYVLNFFEAAQ